MSVFSDDKQNYLNMVSIVQGLAGDETRFSYETGPAEIRNLNCLDVALFQYRRSVFLVLCVLNERTGQGDPYFTNTNTGNVLLSCFRLDGVSMETLEIIFNSLYRNEINVLRKIGTYRYFKTMFSILLGKRQYRTFNKLQISGLTRFILKEKQDGRG